MSNSGQNVKDEAVREVAFGDLNATYTALGSALAHDCFTLSIFNDTDANVYVSTDATTDMKKIAAQTGRVFDYKTNDMFRKKDTQFYVKYDSAPSSGSFWIEVEYV